MIELSYSVSEGPHNPRHNLDPVYRAKEQHIDASRTHLNQVLRRESVREAYDRLFGEAVEKYNKEQREKKHPERQIEDYYEKVRNAYLRAAADVEASKKSYEERKAAYDSIPRKTEKDKPPKIKQLNVPEPCYEIVLQFGSHETIQQAIAVLGMDGVNNLLSDCFNRIAEKTEGGIDWFQAAIHWDEPNGTPHLHMAGIFYEANSNTKGLDVQVTKSGAKRTLGAADNLALREVFWNAMGEVASDYGIKRKVFNREDEERLSHLAPAAFRAKMEAIEKLDSEISKKETEIHFAGIDLYNTGEQLKKDKSQLKSATELLGETKNDIAANANTIAAQELTINEYDKISKKAKETATTDSNAAKAAKEELNDLKRAIGAAETKKQQLEEELKPLLKQKARLKKEVEGLEKKKGQLEKIVDRFIKRLDDLVEVALNMFRQDSNYLFNYRAESILKPLAERGNSYASELVEKKSWTTEWAEWQGLNEKEKEDLPFTDWFNARQKFEKDAAKDAEKIAAHAAAAKKKRANTYRSTQQQPAPYIAPSRGGQSR